jgi:DNA relaxase NicK
MMKAGTIVSADIDWLTLTFAVDAPCVGDLDAYATSVILKHTFRGHTMKPNSAQGYHGNATPNFHFGGRADGYMMRLSSDCAVEEFESLRRFVTYARCTRIDTKIDVIREEEDTQFAGRLRRAIASHYQASGLRRTPKVGLIEGSGVGNSITLLSRSGSRYGRIYDKSSQSRGQIIPNVTRFEVEWKQRPAREIFAAMLNATDRRRAIIGLNAAFFARYGISEGWQEEVRPVTLPTNYNPTDDERSLEYLLHQVAPMLKRLIIGGNLEEVRDILQPEIWALWAKCEVSAGFNATNARALTLDKLETTNADVYSSDL